MTTAPRAADDTAAAPAGLQGGEHPLAATAGRLSALHEYLSYRIGQPAGCGWHRLADLTDVGLLRRWHHDLVARHGDRRAAACYLGGWVADAAVDTWALPVWAEARLPLVGAHGVSVHRHADGWLDAVAVAPDAAQAILAGDPSADHPGSVVLSSREALVDALADRLLELGPVLQSMAGALPVSAPVLRGALVDAIASRALWLARLRGRDRFGAWRDAETLVGHLAVRGPRSDVRPPRPFEVEHAHGCELFAVRTTCCLYYRTVADPDRDGDGYCSTCPLRTDASRRRRLRVHLDDEGNRW